MARLAVGLMLVAMFALSSVALDAQRGVGAGGGRGGGARGGNGVVTGRGGFQFRGRINVPPALPSINRPSFPIDGLNRPAFPLSGPLGFGPTRRSPFDARRGTYTRLQQFGGIP